MKRFDGNREHRSRRLWKTISFLLVMAMVFTTVTIQWPFPAQASGTSVYLNGSGGSDSADGSSEAAAVQSFGRAKELAGGSGEILVCGTVYTSGDTTWSLPGGVSLRRAPGFSGAIVNISGTLTLKNISLSSGDISGSGSIAGEDKTEPTKEPTAEPTKEPTAEPTKEPTKEPTAEPSEEPTKEPTKEPEKESGPLENLQVSAGNEEDVQTILEAYQWYEGCTEDEQSMVPQDLVIRLKKAQSACKVYNRTSNGITVSGEFPWYVQFRVTQGSQDANFDLGDLLGSYDMELWNLLEDEPYDLNGTPVTVTIPVSDADKYEKISVIHYLEDGSYEVLTPEVLDGAIRFTTTSFSPYSVAGEGRIAGSTVLVGPGDAIYNQSGGSSQSGSTSTGSNQQVSSVGASHSQSASGSGSSSVVRPQNSGGSSSSSSYDSDSRSTSDSERSNTRTASSVRTDDPNNLTPYLVVVVVAAALIIILIVAGTISARRKRRK